MKYRQPEHRVEFEININENNADKIKSELHATKPPKVV